MNTAGDRDLAGPVYAVLFRLPPTYGRRAARAEVNFEDFAFESDLVVEVWLVSVAGYSRESQPILMRSRPTKSHTAARIFAGGT